MSDLKEIVLPDIGDFSEVDVIEVLVSPGDHVNAEDSLITLESDKATMEIPSPHAGLIREVLVQVGDSIAKGHPIATLEPEDAAVATAIETSAPHPEGSIPTPEVQSPVESAPPVPGPTPSDEVPLPGTPAFAPPPVPPMSPSELARASAGKAHASPAVRRLARELGVDLSQVRGSGSKGRVLKKDVQGFVKGRMSQAPAPVAPVGFAVSEMPSIDFSRFGEVEARPLSRIQKISGTNLHRNWVTIPHVTQFDEADITELEAFRQAQKDGLAKQGVRLTLLSFLIKAALVALKQFPQFNASLDPGGEHLILKRYYHIGIAVDTPDGLVVPVIRNVDQKGLFQLAGELGEVSEKARGKKLRTEDMQGGTFSISSLGGVGGTAFTPIINAPEVAIMGISRAEMKPVYRDGAFVPRLILPISLSYDHRVIDGATAARFTSTLRTVLSDIRHMLM